MLHRKPSALALTLLPGVLGLLFAGCGGERGAPAEVELSLVAAASPKSTIGERISLPIVSVEAQIDGKWRTLSRAHRTIVVELGALPHPTTLLRVALPAGALTSVRLGIGEHADHLELSAACGQRVPSCATGAISFVLDNPSACLDRSKHDEARLRMLATEIEEGSCSTPADLSQVDPQAIIADPACEGIVCAPTQVCRAGICVASDSCVNVVCAPGQVCSAGQCIATVDMSTSPDLAATPVDMAATPADMAATPSDLASSPADLSTSAPDLCTPVSKHGSCPSGSRCDR